MILLIGMGETYYAYLKSFREDHKASTQGIDLQQLCGYYNVGMVYRIVHSYMVQLSPQHDKIVFMDCTDFPTELLRNKREDQKYIQIVTDRIHPSWTPNNWDALVLDSAYEVPGFGESKIISKVVLDVNTMSTIDKTYKILTL